MKTRNSSWYDRKLKKIWWCFSTWNLIDNCFLLTLVLLTCPYLIKPRWLCLKIKNYQILSPCIEYIHRKNTIQSTKKLLILFHQILPNVLHHNNAYYNSLVVIILSYIITWHLFVLYETNDRPWFKNKIRCSQLFRPVISHCSKICGGNFSWKRLNCLLFQLLFLIYLTA